MAQIRVLANLGGSDFRAWSVDFPNAYKTIGLHDSSLEAATVCFAHPDTNAPYKARILVQPFGSRRAPANWGRVITFIQFLSMELLALKVGAFADDVYCAEPNSLAKSGFWAPKQSTGPLGLHTSDRKDQPPRKDIVLLGALIAIGTESFCASVRPERIHKIS